MLVRREELKELMKRKLMAGGLHEDHADQTAEVLTWSSERGLHSHGEVRVEYYTERIYKGGINVDPKWSWEQTGPCTGVVDGDNGCGYPFAILGLEGDLCCLTMCQSDPMVIPYGGAEPFYGTNPIAFGAPTADERFVNFDMATTVQAWGKILDAKSAGHLIPDDWAVDVEGNPVTDPHKVNALRAIAGPKGYGLMMMVDILSGVLLGVPSGKNVSSMYHDLSEGCDLGHLHIVIDPSRFVGLEEFKEQMSQTLDELGAVRPAPGYDKVYYPGERALIRKAKCDAAGGIEIVDSIYDYLVSDKLWIHDWDHRNRFAE
ncbi:ureidoglycolate dehydrogenase [Olsenella uli]|uniref:ureidoglycolate dehydrogenase n=1 Tax=Olsenella uli TaxID=133926 RepID=UPI0028EAD3E6|nr:ureidoglycolate dehydrogenase [Olsenella uli]